MPRSIARRGFLLIAIPLLPQVLILGVLFRSEIASRDAEQRALQTLEVITRAESAMRMQFEEVSRVRGRIIARNQAFVTPPRDVVGAVLQIRDLVRNDPPQLRRAEVLLECIRKLEERRAALERDLDAGKIDEVAASVRSLRGERVIQEALLKLDDFLETERSRGVERVDRLQRARWAQQLLLLGAVVASIAITLLQARAFARGFSSRLAVVTANARRIAESSPLAPQLGGEDEISELDRTLHDAARRLTAAAEAERRYEAELEERAAELVLTNQDLMHKSREIETFVYSVTHDLRAPLVNLQGFSREIELSCTDLWRTLEGAALPGHLHRELEAIEHDMRESIRFILASVSSSSRLIDALLRLSRAGRVRYQWQTLDIAEIVRRVKDTFRIKIEEKQVVVEVRDLPPARGDTTAVEQVFSNLLSNAINYLDPGRPGRIEIGAELPGPPGSPVTYWVRDNGRGIPEEFRDRLFVAFQRLHRDAAPGEGIGLELVRRIVERHGGSVDFESQEGVGTVFLFTLPGVDPDNPEDDWSFG